MNSEEEILEESRGVFITQALAALLITVSPSLTSLRLTQPFLDWRAFCTTDPRPEEVGYLKPIPDTDYPLASLLHETNIAPEKKPYLQNLCSVSVMPKRVPHYYTMNLNGVLALVNRLPSIETVRAGLLFQQVDWCGPPLEPCKFSRISITDSWLPTFSLASLVVPCETLREFRYTLMAYFESGLSLLKEIEGVEGQSVEAEVNLDTDEEFDAWDPDEGLEDSDE